MTTLIKDPMSGTYIVKEGDSLSKIASNQGVTLAELLATNPEYASNPNLIHPGDAIKVGTNTEPNYSNLTSSQNNNNQGGGFTVPTTPTGNPSTMSFTDALIKMLKDKQAQTNAGKDVLTSQSNKITGQGINDAIRIFKNPLLGNSSGTSLANSAGSEYEPLQLSLADQQKRATENLNNFSDVVDKTISAYEDEQDRKATIAKAASGDDLTAGEKYKLKLGSYRNGFTSGKMLDQYTPIMVNGYVTIAAWKSAINDAQSKGISREDFVKEYADLLSPGVLDDYGLSTSEKAIVKNLGITSANSSAITNPFAE